MKFIKYGKYVADPFEGLSAEDLMQMLQDFLLDSGFFNQFYGLDEMDSERTLWSSCARRFWRRSRAGEDSRENFWRRCCKIPKTPDLSQGRVDQPLLATTGQRGLCLDRTAPEPGRPVGPPRALGQMGQQEGSCKIRDYRQGSRLPGLKTLKDLLGSLGKASFGRHDTRELATGVESDGLKPPL